jgi:hypothetical protein
MVESGSSMEPRVCIIDDMIIQCEEAWTIPNLAALDHTLQTIQWPVMSELMWGTMKISAMDTGGAVLLHRTVEPVVIHY